MPMVEFLTMTKLLLAIAAMAALSAQSQPPPPTPAKTGQDDQGKANPIKQETGTNQKPTKQLSAPPEAGVSIAATYNQQAPGKNNEGEPTSNWWLVAIAILNLDRKAYEAAFCAAGGRSLHSSNIQSAGPRKEQRR